MKKVNSLIHLNIITALVILSLSGSSYAWTGPSKKILILHSYNKGLNWTENIESGIKSVLMKAGDEGLSLKIDYEYMDSKRFVDEAHYQRLFNLYKFKADRIKYDLIISSDDNALKFLLKYRDEIFGPIPVIFCGVNFFSEKMFKGHSNYTGVVEEPDIKSTLNLALKLHPGTQEFCIIGDNTSTSVSDRETLNRNIGEFRGKNIRFIILKNADINKYKTILKNLEEGSIAVAMHVNRDNKGHYYSYEESFDIYTEKVKVPVYTFWDFYLGRGAMGGTIISGFAQGESAARMALQVVQGQKVKNIPVMKKSPNRYMLDYEVMKKFGIDTDEAPPGTTIINRPETFSDIYEKFGSVIIETLVVILILLSIIAVLVINILKRRKVQKNLLNTNQTYDKFVPHEFLDNIGRKSILDVRLGDQSQKEMTVMFSGINPLKGTEKKQTAAENFSLLSDYLQTIGPVVRSNGGFVDKYIGQTLMAIFPGSPEDAVAASVEMQKTISRYNDSRIPVSVGIGIHTGSLMMGTVGEDERMEGTVISDAVNLASRIQGLTKIYGAAVIVSGDILSKADNIKNKYKTRLLGRVIVKGKKDPVDIYEVIDGDKGESARLKEWTLETYSHAMECYEEKNIERASMLFSKVIEVNPEDKASLRYLSHCQELAKEGMPEDWNSVEKFEIK